MKLTIYIITLCAGLVVMAGCSKCSDTTNDEKSKALWQRYNEARKANDLDRTLVVIDSLEQAKTVCTAKGDYLRGMAYDQGW